MSILSDRAWQLVSGESIKRNAHPEAARTMRWNGSPWHKKNDNDLSLDVGPNGYKLFVIDVVGSDIQHLWRLTQDEPFSMHVRDEIYSHGKDVALHVLYGRVLDPQEELWLPRAVKLRQSIEPLMRNITGKYATCPAVVSYMHSDIEPASRIAYFLQTQTADCSHYAMISLTKTINVADRIFVAGEKHDAVILAARKDIILTPRNISDIKSAYSGTGISLIKIKEVCDGQVVRSIVV